MNNKEKEFEKVLEKVFNDYNTIEYKYTNEELKSLLKYYKRLQPNINSRKREIRRINRIKNRLNNITLNTTVYEERIPAKNKISDITCNNVINNENAIENKNVEIEELEFQIEALIDIIHITNDALNSLTEKEEELIRYKFIENIPYEEIVVEKQKEKRVTRTLERWVEKSINDMLEVINGKMSAKCRQNVGKMTLYYTI